MKWVIFRCRNRKEVGQLHVSHVKQWHNEVKSTKWDEQTQWPSLIHPLMIDMPDHQINILQTLHTILRKKAHKAILYVSYGSLILVGSVLFWMKVINHTSQIFIAVYLQFCSSANTSDTTARVQKETHFTTCSSILVVLFGKYRFMRSELLKYSK